MSVLKAFILTYLGVVSGLSLGYFLGKGFGHKIVDNLLKKKKAKYLVKSKELIDRYGHFALVISYFIPIVRHIIPYLVGMNKMPFLKYAMYSYTTGFIWTLLYFTLGLFFGKHIEYISDLATRYGIYFGIFVAIVGCLYYWYIRKFKR